VSPYYCGLCSPIRHSFVLLDWYEVVMEGVAGEGQHLEMAGTDHVFLLTRFMSLFIMLMCLLMTVKPWAHGI
jgi:hypothetical protein